MADGILFVAISQQKEISTQGNPGCYFYTQNCPERRKTTNAWEATPYKSVARKEQYET
ncbi:hypothetical protein CLOSTHATH_05105 [Hungatella hathewayi DSM 13479]|uniref:Uncharacterized protein n=1 Tax=Hungatella hathewayi DSM 13479 TaxID=566550 RepID=D3ANA5_9FIRM|nr:hypothetical protein CLOSTHATH_05105 [Hungatella hathewayi DSM 13479]DAN96908.1 MAG TPA: hypothetical protein [Caudoviricetes sp.]